LGNRVASDLSVSAISWFLTRIVISTLLNSIIPMADNTFESQQCEWNSLNSFELGSVRDELEDSAAALPRADDLGYRPHPGMAGITERVTTGPRVGARAVRLF